VNNWEDNVLPTAGDVISFPENFDTFNLEECTTVAEQCEQGGVVLIKAPKGQTTAEVEITRLELPENSKLEFQGRTKMYLVESTSKNEKKWKEREHQFDFNCAANWVVTGTALNPNFKIPCYSDVAVFSDVCSFRCSCDDTDCGRALPT
jgi:hypothetical protein